MAHHWMPLRNDHGCCWTVKDLQRILLTPVLRWYLVRKPFCNPHKLRTSRTDGSAAAQVRPALRPRDIASFFYRKDRAIGIDPWCNGGGVGKQTALRSSYSKKARAGPKQGCGSERADNHAHSLKPERHAIQSARDRAPREHHPVRSLALSAVLPQHTATHDRIA